MKNDILLLAGILKKRRITLGYSLRSLAEEVGISHTELARIENGNRTNFSLIVIIRLCEVLKIDFVNLLTITGYISPRSEFDDCSDYEELEEDEYEEDEDDILDFDIDMEFNPDTDELHITVRLIND